jgi:hypothetical protein
MKGNFFTFDAFGQWREHDRSKMKWRMKVGIEWMLGMASRPKIGGRPATFSLLFPFRSTIYPFSSTTTPLGQGRGAMATWVGRLTTSWLRYKRVAKGSFILHPTSSQATSNFLNPSPSSELAQVSVRVLVLKLSQGSVLASFIACNLSTQPFVSFHPFG